MFYTHKFVDENIPIGSKNPTKVLCVGMNYLKHIEELNNIKPKDPVLFIKPFTTLVEIGRPIIIPNFDSDCHHEIELGIVLNKKLKNATQNQVKDAILGYVLALDLTARDLQTQLRNSGHPWEKSKSFDNSCPVSPIIPKTEIKDPQNIEIELKINGKTQQKTNTNLMITKIYDLIVYMSKFFTIYPGDVILTGTPEGVSPLKSNYKLELILDQKYKFETEVK